MLVLYFCCPRCRKTLRLGQYRVRPQVVCPHCLLTFRMPAYGETRLGIRKGITTPRYDMLNGIHRN